MALPLASAANPILYHERKVWLKGNDPANPSGLGTNLGICSLMGRNAARPYALSHVFAAAGSFPYAVLYTPNPLTFTRLNLLAVDVLLESCSAAAIVSVQLVTISSAPTGGVAVAPRTVSAFAAVPASLGMVLATGGAAAIAIVSMVEYNLGVTGAASVVNPPPALQQVPLWPINPAVSSLPLPGATGADRGWMVRVEVSAACTVNLLARFMFFEET